MSTAHDHWREELKWALSWPKAGNNTDLKAQANIALCKTHYDYREYPPGDFRRVADFIFLTYQLRDEIPPQDRLTFLMEVRERPRGLYFDLEYPKEMGAMPYVDVGEVHKALCHCLRLVIPSSQFYHKEAKWRVYWVDGSRPGKALSYHAHFPHVTCSKESMIEIYARLAALPTQYPDDPQALFMASILDPAPAGGGLYGPFTCKFDSTQRRLDQSTYKQSLGTMPFWTGTNELSVTAVPAETGIIFAMPDVLPNNALDLRVLGPVHARTPPRAGLFLPEPVLPNGGRFDRNRDLVSVLVDSDLDFSDLGNEVEYLDGGEDVIQFISLRFFQFSGRAYWRNSLGKLTNLAFRDCHAFDQWKVPCGPSKRNLDGTVVEAKKMSFRKALSMHAPLITGLVFHPTRLTAPIMRAFDGNYNLWEGLEAYKHLEKPFTRDIEDGIGLWLFTIFRNLTTCELVVLDAYVCWLASIVQYPDTPTEKCPLMVGKPSGGKTRINNNLVKYVFGTAHSTCINTVNDLLGNFNYHDDKLFIYVDEMTPNNMPKLNSILTPTTFGTMSNKKGRDPQLTIGRQNITASSNNLWPFDNMQRRYLCMRTNPLVSSAIQVVGSEHRAQVMKQFDELDLFYASYGHMLGAWLYRIDIPQLPVRLTDIPSRTYNRLHCEMRYLQLHNYVKALVTSASIGCNHNLLTVADRWLDKNNKEPYRLSDYLDYLKQQTGGAVRQAEVLEVYSKFHISIEVKGGIPCILFPPLDEFTSTFLSEEECFRIRKPDGTSTIRNIFAEEKLEWVGTPENTELGSYYNFFSRYKLKP